MQQRRIRDRHGRRRSGQVRGPLFPQDVPRFRTRRQLFDTAVLEAYAPLQELFAAQLTQLDIAVDTVPRMRLSGDVASLPDEVTADGPVPLGRVIPAGIDAKGRPTRARIVVFRMPIEQRVTSAQERQELLHNILVSLMATYLNITPEQIDPNFSW